MNTKQQIASWREDDTQRGAGSSTQRGAGSSTQRGAGSFAQRGAGSSAQRGAGLIAVIVLSLLLALFLGIVATRLQSSSRLLALRIARNTATNNASNALTQFLAALDTNRKHRSPSVNTLQLSGRLVQYSNSVITPQLITTAALILYSTNPATPSANWQAIQSRFANSGPTCLAWRANSSSELGQRIKLTKLSCTALGAIPNVGDDPGVFIAGDLQLEEKLELHFPAHKKYYIAVLGSINLKQGLNLTGLKRNSIELIAGGDIEISSLTTEHNTASQLHMHSASGNVRILEASPVLTSCGSPGGIETTIEARKKIIFGTKDTSKATWNRRCGLARQPIFWKSIDVLGSY